MNPVRLIGPALLFSLLTISCAKQTAPTGGPKDTIPPNLISVLPKKNTVNFSGNTIEMTFDEYINLDNPQEQILITPDVGKKFDVTAKKKKVTLVFEEALKDSITYSINFRDAVKDITEKNPAENLKIAFSTGTYIDSLSLRGIVKDPLMNKEVKNATVAIYESDTFNIFSHKPSYISKTNDKGQFVLENLKHGEYYLYAFNDVNRNLIVDSKTEGYGFDTTSINLNRNTIAPTLSYIRLDSRPIRLTSARPYNTYFNIKFSKPLDNYDLITQQPDTIASILDKEASSIKIYNTFQADSILIRVIANDSLSQTVDTTLYVKFSPRQATPEQFAIMTEDWKIITEKGTVQGTIGYNKPIRTINFDSIYLRLDSATSIPFSKADFTWNHLTNKITVTKTIDKTLLKTSDPQPSKSTNINQLYIGQAAFISVEQDSSLRLTEKPKQLNLEETGIIRVNIQTTEPNFIVQLTDKNYKIIRQIRNRSSIAFEDLVPGDYQLRLIIDSDNNNRWSPGNFSKRQKTESIKYFENDRKSTIISLKANWEIGPLLISN